MQEIYDERTAFHPCPRKLFHEHIGNAERDWPVDGFKLQAFLILKGNIAGNKRAAKIATCASTELRIAHRALDHAHLAVQPAVGEIELNRQAELCPARRCRRSNPRDADVGGNGLTKVETVEYAVDGIARFDLLRGLPKIGRDRLAARLSDRIGDVGCAAALGHKGARGAGCHGIDLAGAIREGAHDEDLAAKGSGARDTLQRLLDAEYGWTALGSSDFVTGTLKSIPSAPPVKDAHPPSMQASAAAMTALKRQRWPHLMTRSLSSGSQ